MHQGGLVQYKVHWKGTTCAEDEWFDRTDLIVEFPAILSKYEEEKKALGEELAPILKAGGRITTSLTPDKPNKRRRSSMADVGRVSTGGNNLGKAFNVVAESSTKDQDEKGTEPQHNNIPSKPKPTRRHSLPTGGAARDSLASESDDGGKYNIRYSLSYRYFTACNRANHDTNTLYS